MDIAGVYALQWLKPTLKGSPMAKKRRDRKLRSLAPYLRNLQTHRPDLKGNFLCPLCFREIKQADIGEISIAHILPKAANAHLTTFLCRSCNGELGQRQDRWLGDHLRVAHKTGFERFMELEKDSRFSVDDLPVNGVIKPSGSEGVDVFIDLDRNPPGTGEKLEDLFGSQPRSISLNVGLPLLRNRRLVPIGFLTSAYLLWFRRFGYSESPRLFRRLG